MADVELLPLSQREVYDESFWQEGIAGGANVVTYNGEDVRGVCRIEDANTRRLVINQHNAAIRNTRVNIAPLQAENERLRSDLRDYMQAANAEATRAERLAEALRVARARAADLAAWLKSGNDVPVDLPFVFRERWQKITNDIRVLEAALAQEDRNG